MRGYSEMVFILLVSLVLITGVGLASGETVVETEGMASIIDGDIARSRELAVHDALRNAVEQAVGAWVDAETRVLNYELIEDSILLKSHGYVSTYTVITSRIESDIYYVQVSATIVDKILKDDLATLQLLIQRANDPRMMVVVPEKHGETMIADPAAETAIIGRLLEAGFRLVDQDQARVARESEVVRQALNGNQEAMDRLASQFQADLLVIGEAYSELASIYEDFYSCNARVDLRVVWTDTGEILTAHGVNGSDVDLSEMVASKKALTLVGEEMAVYLIEALPKMLVDQERSIQLSIEGVSFGDLKRLERKLKEAHLIQGVYIRDFSGGYAKVDVETSLLPMELADLIYEWYDELALDVIGLSGSKLELKKQ